MKITPQFFHLTKDVRFKDSTDINNYFSEKTGKGFVQWFNENLSFKGQWRAIKMQNGSEEGFNQVWDNIPIIFGTPYISLLQFLSLMGIINTETGGYVKPLSEWVGNQSNPGISYAFNKIAGVKISYNRMAGNKTAYSLFNDQVYKEAHGKLPLAEKLKDTNDKSWDGERYPFGFGISENPAVTGFVLEADFYKFRGRGLIGTTGRANYKELIRFILSYKGNDPVVNFYKARWQGKDLDTIATISTNADWDTLFQKTGLIIASAAIAFHNRVQNNYLSKLIPIEGVEANIWWMGKKVNGANAYANLFADRIIESANKLYEFLEKEVAIA